MTQATIPNFAVLEKDVKRALKQWHDSSHAPSPFAYLYLFRNALRQGHSNPKQITNQLLFSAIETLEQSYPQDAKLLKKRFWDLEAVTPLANQWNVAQSTLFVMQRQAISRLTEIVHDQEMQARSEQQTLLDKRLEATSYIHLVGIEQHIAYLTSLLTSPKPPWLISIEGIGGIGKTSLADVLVRHVFDQNVFDDFGWVSARQTILNMGGGLQTINEPVLTSESLVEKLVLQLIPDFLGSGALIGEKMLAVLRSRLKQISHLIVIDNLETLADVEHLLPTLQKLANPTKFLLTSRESLYTEPNVCHFVVPELSESSALQLIRQEALWSNLPVLASCSDDELRPIYTTVGGNPLAIRLVVGQTHMHSLEAILNDLAEACGLSATNLYTYIYRRAWENLDPLSQRVLLAMPLVNASGDNLSYLAGVSDLPSGDLRTALNKLVTLNLINSTGGLHERKYWIHGLTRSFLQNQVAKW